MMAGLSARCRVPWKYWANVPPMIRTTLPNISQPGSETIHAATLSATEAGSAKKMIVDPICTNIGLRPSASGRGWWFLKS